ncbi:MAG: DUF2341 domain-containing protein [Candidatus Bathyarchaeota archaeon]|nr:DUF2341 domain-containing protein [Candidatus Bathyarchaeum tardum]WGM89359.1 MAG: DUF2341 domain-containing protein [Candidatus Bathyarchaeum tardum]
MKIGNKKIRRRVLKNVQNNGISPILASLLLIVIVVAAAIVAYSWVQSTTTTQLNQASGFIIMENVRFYDSDKIELSIRNTGTGDLKVDTIYIDDVPQKVAQQIPSKECISIVLDHNWELGTKYRIKTATTAGLYAEKTCMSPSSLQVGLDEVWTKRKQVTIDNSLNPEGLTNYQIKINVPYDSDMNSDFSDLRFTNSDEQTLIPYWIESYIASDSTVVWVNIPSIPALSTETVYMYYGNPSASSESDPEETFDIFLDFTTAGVETYGGTNQDRDPTQVEIIGDTTLHMWGNNWKAVMKTINVVGDGSQAICFDFKSNGTQAEINAVGLDTDSSISESQTYRIYGTQNWGRTDHYGYTPDEWQAYSIILDDFSGSFNRIVIVNDADAAQATNVYYRNVRVAKTTSIEPVTSLGAEETV